MNYLPPLPHSRDETLLLETPFKKYGLCSLGQSKVSLCITHNTCERLPWGYCIFCVWVLLDKRYKVCLLRSILQGKSTSSRTRHMDKVPIELYGQGFAPVVKIYCLMLWLIQQPVPLPQQPCWSPRAHLQTGSWLNTKFSESHLWCDGLVAKLKPPGICCFPFATYFLVVLARRWSPPTFNLWQIDQQAAVKHKCSPVKIKIQGHYQTALGSKILPQVNFLCLRTQRDRELLGPLKVVRMDGRAMGSG